MTPAKAKPLALKDEGAQTPAPVTRPSTPMEMIAQVLEMGDLDKLDRMMDLQLRWEKNEARKAFLEAKAAFKLEAPTVVKDKKNTQYKSTYSSIGNLVGSVNAALAKHGLDASWEIEQGEKVTITCVLAHVLGHSERVSMSAPPDTSGQKNPIQQIKSTITYLKVATYEAVTGIATEEGNRDDDGNAANDGPITKDQAEELAKLADSVGADKAKFCAYFRIDSFADIQASQFEKAKKAILAKRKKAEEASDASG
jgi:hypothetical protein